MCDLYLDVNLGNLVVGEWFKVVLEVYNVLLDLVKCKEYDEICYLFVGGGFGGCWFDSGFGGGFGGFGVGGDGVEFNFNDLFDVVS